LDLNFITAVNAYLFKLPKLRYLQLNRNKIEHLPSIGVNHSLEALGLNDNLISQIPIDFLKFTNLSYLRLSENMLTHFPTLDSINSIERINLRKNLFETIPKPLMNCYDLDLSYNYIGIKGDTVNLDLDCSKLNLSDNYITTLQIKNGTNLKELNLHSNYLNSLPSSIIELEKLSELNIGSNYYVLDESAIDKIKLLKNLELLTLDSYNNNEILEYMKQVLPDIRIVQW